MKNLIMVAAFLFVFFAAGAFVNDATAGCGSCAASVGSESKDADLTPIDTDDMTDTGDEDRPDVTEDQGVPSEESYDENTGLPDVDTSDKEWIE